MVGLFIANKMSSQLLQGLAETFQSSVTEEDAVLCIDGKISDLVMFGILYFLDPIVRPQFLGAHTFWCPIRSGYMLKDR